MQTKPPGFAGRFFRCTNKIYCSPVAEQGGYSPSVPIA